MENNKSILVKVIYITLGVTALGLGAIGTAVPLIPTTPLVILAAVCFGKSSQRLHTWFLTTRLYKSTVKKFIQKRVMTLKAKLILISSITIFMGISFLTMVIFHVPYFVRIILVVIWLLHVVYFGFKVKTAEDE